MEIVDEFLRQKKKNDKGSLLIDKESLLNDKDVLVTSLQQQVTELREKLTFEKGLSTGASLSEFVDRNERPRQNQ